MLLTVQGANSQEGNSLDGVVFSKLKYYSTTEPTSLEFLDDMRYKQLCVVLDEHSTAENGCGWKALAEHLGIKNIITLQALQKQEHVSPSVVLLDAFFKNHKDSGRRETLLMLSNYLRKINNMDAKDLVEEQLDEDHNLPVTDSDLNEASMNMYIREVVDSRT